MNEIATVEKLEKAEQDALAKVRTWDIKSNEDYSALDSFTKGLQSLKRTIIDDFADSKKAAKATHQAVCDQESAHLGKVEEAIREGKVKLFTWDKAQEKARQEAEDKARAEAKAKADQEALDAATAAQKSGDHEGAKAILEEAVQAPAPTVIVPSMVPKRQTVIRTVKKFRIKDPKAIKPEFLTPDEKKIGGIVRSMGKGAESVVGGIEVYEEPC